MIWFVTRHHHPTESCPTRTEMKNRKAFVDYSIVTPTIPLDSTTSTTTSTTSAAMTTTTSSNSSIGGRGGLTTNATRRRSLSLAEPQPSVETVIVKAKRAAQSLWMLLHAQVRHVGRSANDLSENFYQISHSYIILRTFFFYARLLFLSMIELHIGTTMSTYWMSRSKTFAFTSQNLQC